MILGNIRHLEYYNFFDHMIKKCFEYAKQHDLLSYKPGTYQIDGEMLYVNIAEYETTSFENRFWEAHRKYLDLHLILMGQERIDAAFIESMEEKEYSQRDDFLSLRGKATVSYVLDKDDFMICYPCDAHMTGLAADKPVYVKKAIFKICI